MNPGSGGSSGGVLLCSVLDQVTPCGVDRARPNDVGGQGASPVEQGRVAGGLVAVEQELPDSCGAAAAGEVVPVSGVEPDRQAAVPQGLQAGVDGVLPSWLRVDLVQQEEQPHGAGGTVAPAVAHRRAARSWWYRVRHRPAAGMVPDGYQSGGAAGGDVHQVAAVQRPAGGGQGVGDPGGAVGEPGQEVLPAGRYPPVESDWSRFSGFRQRRPGHGQPAPRCRSRRLAEPAGCPRRRRSRRCTAAGRRRPHDAPGDLRRHLHGG